MTNADCIRRMNDDQLYDFLSEWECGDIDYSITFCDLCKQGGNELNLDCDGCRKHWLQRDAVEYGGLMYWKRNTVFDTADRKTSNSSEIPNNSTISKMEQVEDEPQLTPNYCGTCEHREVPCGDLPCDVCHGYSNYEPKDEPQTEREDK